MTQNGLPAPPADANIVGAERRRENAVLLHMNTSAAASWLKSNMEAFLAAMGGTSVYKESLTNVVVQYVPVSFDPALDGALRVVEDDNGFRRGAVASAKWIKAPELHHAGQKVAHAILGFSDDPAAN
ncbi:hypothetical protein B0H19DRAFT_938412, partial [Mycena capillaripes]